MAAQWCCDYLGIHQLSPFPVDQVLGALICTFLVEEHPHAACQQGRQCDCRHSHAALNAIVDHSADLRVHLQ